MASRPSVLPGVVSRRLLVASSAACADDRRAIRGRVAFCVTFCGLSGLPADICAAFGCVSFYGLLQAAAALLALRVIAGGPRFLQSTRFKAAAAAFVGF